MTDLSSSVYDPKTYWEKRLAAGPDLDSVGYLGCGWGYNYWLYRVRRNVLERALARLGIIQAGNSVLEVAVGSGFYLPVWHRHGVKDLVGVDITEVAVERARRLWPGYRFVQADIGSPAPPVSGAFDIVTAFDVLFHLVDDRTWSNAVCNLMASVRPGGWLLMTDAFLPATVQSAGHHKARALCEYTELLEKEFEIVARIPVFVVMIPAFHAGRLEGAAIASVWAFSTRLLDLADRFGQQRRVGYWIGALLYPLELLLGRMLSDGPSMELLICRKRK